MNCILLTNFMSRITSLWRMQAASEQNVSWCMWLSRKLSRTHSLTVPLTELKGSSSAHRCRTLTLSWSPLWLKLLKICPRWCGVHCWLAAGRLRLGVLASSNGNKDQLCLKLSSTMDCFLSTQGSSCVLISLLFCFSNSVAGKALRCKCTGQGCVSWVLFSSWFLDSSRIELKRQDYRAGAILRKILMDSSLFFS